MSDHRHMFWTPSGEMPRCDCGKDILAVFNEQEQQLAEARALLEEVGNNQEVGVADGDCDTICFYCGGDEDGWIEDGPPPYIRTYNHTPDCTWVKIRAFLQKIGG